MAQFKRQKPPRAGALPGAEARPFAGTHPTSLLGPPPGLLNPPVSADLIQNAQQLQMGEKQRVFTGIVTSLHDYFGVVDEEVFFQLSVVKGRLPQIGEKVLVKAVYNPSQSVPWNALKVQTLSNQPLLKAPTPLLNVASLGQKQGILGAHPQLLFQPHRIPPLFPQKPMSLFQSSASLQLGRYPGQGLTGRWDEFNSKKRKQKGGGGKPWGVKKPCHDPPQYRVYFARYAVDSPFCDAMELLRRYCSIQLPSEFYDVRLCWLDTFPLTQPLILKHPSRIHVANTLPEVTENTTPEDMDPSFSAKVMLLSSPGLAELYRHCLLYIEGPSEPKESPEHPTKQIQFLLGRKDTEAVLIGGAWSPALDGPEPDSDPLVLVRTAIRCTKAQTGLDLSTCTKWVRFAEFRYLCQGDPAQKETVVVFLPDIWSCMPSLEAWEKTLYQQKEKAEKPPSPPEAEVEISAEVEPPALKDAVPDIPAPPMEPALIAHPTTLALANLSLWTLLEYRRQREKLAFEVAVIAELFQEMLQRDFGYTLYKVLRALPDKEEPSPVKIVQLEKPEKDTVQPNKEAGPGPAHACSDVAKAASTEEGCVLSLEDDLLLLQQEEEDDDFGVKVEDAEVSSIASNPSELEFSSHDNMISQPKELAPSAVLPLDALLAFIYFDLNFCGYLHRGDLEKILMTVGLHLCKEQVKQLVNRVGTQYVCQYRSLHFNCQEECKLEEELLFLGNLALLPFSNPNPLAVVSGQPKAVGEHGDLISHKGTVLNVERLLEKAEHTEGGRLYLESKIHTLEVKLEDAQLHLAATESSNKMLSCELQELEKQLANMEEQVKSADQQKSHFQRLLQENKKRLAPLQLELQQIIEKTSNCLEKEKTEPASTSNN